jgi:hypothetical protein
MFNLYEMFRQAQGGAAFDNIARAYGMSSDQMRAAVAALTPAFAQGFQRQAQSEDAARRFAALFQTEAFARAFDAQAAALDPATRNAGDDALGALFGSKEVSRAVAAQAAAASGVQAEIIRKVLPVLTSVLIGGFMKAAQGAQPAPGGGAAPFPGPLGEFWGQILGGLAGPGAAAPSPETRRPAGETPQNPFQDWMGGFKAEPGANPMGDMVAEMLSGMFGGQKPAAEPRQGPTETPEPPPQEDPAAGTPFDELVETGRELSAQNAKAMERIFDAFFSQKKDPA